MESTVKMCLNKNVLIGVGTLLLVIFAASFFHPRTGRDWRVLGGFSAFAVALFTEMPPRSPAGWPLKAPTGGSATRSTQGSSPSWSDSS
ncbi:hypothetical protein NLX86_12050 [Streptomyces sp. A3M-1-3]|uniref:hypothetical protein n=1 Tax=Streptomyces sp. A3M-1-3 TaxID=2962044 RepID=UPI0020B7028A|nr:hypothetical protein [Streptomyces sp. A3M-1-3]MCP3818814.1 hypothetical protein [Streptomyces sp. A3M-1-3]